MISNWFEDITKISVELPHLSLVDEVLDEVDEDDLVSEEVEEVVGQKAPERPRQARVPLWLRGRRMQFQM